MSCETILPGLGYDLLACGKYKSNCRVILVKGTHSLIWCNQTGSTTTSVTTDTQAPALEATTVVSTTNLPTTTTTETPYEYSPTPSLRGHKYILNSTHTASLNVSRLENTTNQSTFDEDTREFIPLDIQVFPGVWIGVGLMIFLIVLAFIKYKPKWEPCKVLPEKPEPKQVTNQRGPSGQTITFKPRGSKRRKPVTFGEPIRTPPEAPPEVPPRPVGLAPVLPPRPAPAVPQRAAPPVPTRDGVPVFSVDDLSGGGGYQLFKTLREHKRQMHKK
jgi:hypothetical protein